MKVPKHKAYINDDGYWSTIADPNDLLDLGLVENIDTIEHPILWKLLRNASKKKVIYRAVDPNTFDNFVVVEFEGKRYKYSTRLADSFRGQYI